MTPASEHPDRIVRTEAPASPPGTLTVEEGAPAPVLQLIGYGPDGYEECDLTTDALDVIGRFLERWPVTWLNVDGLGDPAFIEALGALFDIHRLTLEDIVHVHQRAKVEAFPGYLFIVARMADRREQLDTEQLSVVLGRNFVLTFQEGVPGDCLDAVRARVRTATGRLRDRHADYLAYAVLDAAVDHYFPVLEHYHDALNGLEEEILDGTQADVVQRVHAIKRDLNLLQRAHRPTFEALHLLQRESEFVREYTRLYLRDVEDHARQLDDLLATYLQLCKDLIDLHLSLAGHRMNEVMKVLTVIGSIFLPLTFVTGLYGMNFDTSSPFNLPELGWAYGYPFALGVMGVAAVGLLWFFYRRGWLGGPGGGEGG